MISKFLTCSILMVLPTYGFAQDIEYDYANDNFSWTSCEKAFPSDFTDTQFANVSFLLDEFRAQNPSLQMPTPSREHCYLKVAEPDTFLAGYSSIEFYPSNDWRTCIEYGTSCEDTSNGYSTSALVRLNNGEAIGMEYIVMFDAIDLRMCVKMDGTAEFGTCLE